MRPAVAGADQEQGGGDSDHRDHRAGQERRLEPAR